MVWIDPWDTVGGEQRSAVVNFDFQTSQTLQRNHRTSFMSRNGQQKTWESSWGENRKQEVDENNFYCFFVTTTTAAEHHNAVHRRFHSGCFRFLLWIESRSLKTSILSSKLCATDDVERNRNKFSLLLWFLINSSSEGFWESLDARDGLPLTATTVESGVDESKGENGKSWKNVQNV